MALVAGLYFLLRSTIGLPFDPLAALGNFNPLNNAPSTGAPSARRGTPRPLPQGALAISAFDLDVASTCPAHLNLQLTKGGQVLASDAAVDFVLSANGQAIPQVTVAPGATSEYGWQLIFRAERLCAGGGTLSVQANAGDSAQGITLCYAGSTATEPPASSQLSASGVQVRTDAYPELKASFSVVDAQNAAVHLPRVVQCTLQQDGQPVPEFVFTPIENASDPVTVALVFDVSGSMQGQPIANARAAATTFVQQLAANNPVCVYAFSTAITRLQACTTDRKAMSAAIGKLNAGGDTALYDALLRVSDDQRKQGGRQVMIVLSDGADTASRAKLDDALAQLQQANLPVYALALVSKDFNGDVLKQIAQTTGASYLETPTSADLDKLYPLIQGQLRTQYGIQFTSRFPERHNGTLDVQLSAAGTRIQFQYPFFVQGP